MENVIMVKEEQKRRASEGSRSWQLGTTMVMKELSGAHNETHKHNYSLWTSFEFSSALLLRQKLKGSPFFSLFYKIWFFFKDCL